MTYQTAEEIGRECGLTQPGEFVLNIELHAISMFAFADIEREIEELHQTADEAGHGDAWREGQRLFSSRVSEALGDKS